jgi:hypothetical protein
MGAYTALDRFASNSVLLTSPARPVPAASVEASGGAANGLFDAHLASSTSTRLHIRRFAMVRIWKLVLLTSPASTTVFHQSADTE